MLFCLAQAEIVQSFHAIWKRCRAKGIVETEPGETSAPWSRVAALPSEWRIADHRVALPCPHAADCR
ncbi:MAG: hypothetical protein JXR13_10140 [Thalassovita sp.]